MWFSQFLLIQTILQIYEGCWQVINELVNLYKWSDSVGKVPCSDQRLFQIGRVGRSLGELPTPSDHGSIWSSVCFEAINSKRKFWIFNRIILGFQPFIGETLWTLCSSGLASFPHAEAGGAVRKAVDATLLAARCALALKGYMPKNNTASHHHNHNHHHPLERSSD